MRARGLAYVLAALPAVCGGASVFPEGARSAALGGAAVTAVNAFAAYNNQAALGFLARPAVAVDYQNRFLTEGLHLASAVFVTPVPYAGVLGMSVCSFGTMPYNEVRAGIAAGRQLGEIIAIGTQVNYTRISIEGYGSAGAVTAELGVLARPLDNLWLGAHAYNLTYSKFISDYYHERLPVIFNIGLGYSVVSDASLFVQGEFASGQRARLKAGIEYAVLPALALRAGIALKPVQLFAGAGCTLRSWVIDFAIARHAALGYSPQLSLSYVFGQ